MWGILPSPIFGVALRCIKCGGLSTAFEFPSYTLLPYSFPLSNLCSSFFMSSSLLLSLRRLLSFLLFSTTRSSSSGSQCSSNSGLDLVTGSDPLCSYCLDEGEARSESLCEPICPSTLAGRFAITKCASILHALRTCFSTAMKSTRGTAPVDDIGSPPSVRGNRDGCPGAVSFGAREACCVGYYTDSLCVRRQKDIGTGVWTKRFVNHTP